MLRSLLTEFVGGARHLVSAIVLLLAGIYVSGFLIVNLYLGRFGVVRLTLVQPRFIAAGVLFMFIAGIASLFALLPLVLVSVLLDWAGWLWYNPQFEQYLARSRPEDRSAAGTRDSGLPPFRERGLGQLLNLFGDAEDIRPGGNWQQAGGQIARRAAQRRWGIRLVKYVPVVIALALAVVTFGLLFAPLEWVGSGVIASLLSWTGRAPLEANYLRSHLESLARLEGLSAFFVVAVYLYTKHLHLFVLRGAVVLILLLFLCTQAYSLIWFANSLYGTLPRSVGGGEPTPVQFLADQDGLQALRELGLPIEQGGDSWGKTEIVKLIDQAIEEGPSATYIVLLCQPSQPCQAVEFKSALVHGLVYERSP